MEKEGGEGSQEARMTPAPAEVWSRTDYGSLTTMFQVRQQKVRLWCLLVEALGRSEILDSKGSSKELVALETSYGTSTQAMCPFGDTDQSAIETPRNQVDL
jgi:hypothetical protein